MNEVLEPLLLAADPSGEARNPLQEGERQRQAGGACDALLSIPFQGAGAENQVEGPGGITVTVEVSQCQGYQASSYFGGLLHPASGKAWSGHALLPYYP